MRNMSSNSFCAADTENLWLQYLARISLVDDLTYTCKNKNVSIVLTPLPLGQFRVGVCSASSITRARCRDAMYCSLYAYAWHTY